jgi:hypothetical protein
MQKMIWFNIILGYGVHFLTIFFVPLQTEIVNQQKQNAK